jgi:hypothetical protein
MGNEGGEKERGLIAIKRDLREERKARGDGGRGQTCGGAQTGRAEERKGEGGRRRGTDRWGPGVSDLGEKENRKREAGRCGKGLSGSVGRCAER